MEESDDYLSDKFLVDATSTDKPKTYRQLRKEAERQSRLENDKNKLKSRHQRELESREEGLSKSLFERANEEEEESSAKNKALSIMMKMGFKPGQALGKSDDDHTRNDIQEIPPRGVESTPAEKGATKHKIEPLPINEEWKVGKKGIGLGKRAVSPTASARIAKMAKMAETSSRDTFRDRSRKEYEERRAEGRLLSAQRTCITLDEKAGKAFHILWLNLQTPKSFPEGLMDALTEHPSIGDFPAVMQPDQPTSVEARVRLQMQSDALQPLPTSAEEEQEGEAAVVTRTDLYSSETIEETVKFLQLNAPDRLRMVLSYLRTRYSYCFWCGMQYNNESEMDEDCPGSDEEAHD